MIFEKKGSMKNGAFHLALLLVAALAIVFVGSFTEAWTTSVLSNNELKVVNYTNITGRVINEDVATVYNFSINHTIGGNNLTVVNISLWGNFIFTSGSNGTGNTTRGGASEQYAIFFGNSSDTIKWNASNATAYILPSNQTTNSSFFWFTATATTPGKYNMTVRLTYNYTSVYNETNVTVVINDTTIPYDITPSDALNRGWVNASDSLAVNLSVFDNGNFTQSNNVETEIRNVNLTVYTSTSGVSASYNMSNVTKASSFGHYWNVTIDTSSFADGIYNISIKAEDKTGNVNNTNISNVRFDNTAPTASAVCSGDGGGSTVNSGEDITCTCSPSDSLSGVNLSATSITENPLTSNTGVYSVSCTFTDMSGNTGSTTAQYTVEQSGVASSSSSGATSSAQTSVTSTDDTAATEKSYTFTTVSPGTPAVKSDFNTDAGVSEITLEVSEAASNVMVTVTEHDGKPNTVSVAREGSVYKYLQIEAENLDGKLDKATIKVQVEKSWVSGNVEGMEDVAVFKFDGSDWNELTTTYDSEDDTYYYYTAEVDSFSYFAIGEKAVEQEEVTATSTTGFERSSKFMWIAIAILLLAIVIGGGIAWKKKN